MTSARETVDYVSRQRMLAKTTQDHGLNAIVLNPGPSLVYFTGLHFHLMERPVVVIISPERPPVIVLPELETGKLNALSYDHRAIPYGEDPASWGKAFSLAVQAAGITEGSLGIEPRNLRVLELRYLEAAAPGARFSSGAATIAMLRVIKSPSEVSAMRAAVEIAQQALQATLPRIHLGMTERDLSAELVIQLIGAGSETPLPFSPIVAFGPNSANPHAFPTGRRLAAGDLILFDWGATSNGYVSDITRVFSAGEAPSRMLEIARLVEAANKAAREAAGPGIPAGSVDHAARQTIAHGGYGDQFIHRTGHGIGMEGHEEPYIRAGNGERLKPGMTFTIEPGIYLSGEGGVRIEDDMLVTEAGAESLTTLPRSLVSLTV